MYVLNLTSSFTQVCGDLQLVLKLGTIQYQLIPVSVFMGAVCQQRC